MRPGPIVTGAIAAAASVAMGVPSVAQVQERPAALALTQAKLYGYATPAIVMNAGEQIAFVNVDIEMHDLVQDVETDGFGAKKRMPWCKKKSKKKGHGHAHDHSGECPLFWTPLISLGESTPVGGTDKLEPGNYSFICTIHHSMKGTLTVL